MQFRVLGPVQATAEGARAELGSDRQRMILTVLLAARGAVVAPSAVVTEVDG